MSERTNSLVTVGADYADHISISQEKFARCAAITPARAYRLKQAGMISGYSVPELVALGQSRRGRTRIVDTPEPLAVLRLGLPRTDGQGRMIGFHQTMTLDEVWEASRRFWKRHPDSLTHPDLTADIDALYVTYAGFVVASFAFEGLDEEAGSGDRFAYRLSPLALMGRFPSDPPENFERPSDLTRTQKTAQSRVGRQLVTPGGGPVIVSYPEPIDG